MNEFTKDTTKPKPIRSREHKECYIYLHTVKQNSTHWWAWAKGFSFRLPLPKYILVLHVRTPLDWASIERVWVVLYYIAYFREAYGEIICGQHGRGSGEVKSSLEYGWKVMRAQGVGWGHVHIHICDMGGVCCMMNWHMIIPLPSAV